MSWMCVCGETHEESFEACWSCGKGRPVGMDAAALRSVSLPNRECEGPSGAEEPSSEYSSGGMAPNEVGLGVVKRYSDAYAIASSIDAHGQAMKSLAVVLAVVVVAITLIGVTQANANLTMGGLMVGGFVAAVVWSMVHAHGVRIAAEGQRLLAALDVAVHTSPFLSNAQRAQVMSL